MKYNKLVRDNIPEIIKTTGKVVITHKAYQKEYQEKLNEKLKEEVNEYLEAENIEELADILEVIYAILDNKNCSKEKIEEIRKEKAKKRGSFNNKIILDEVD